MNLHDPAKDEAPIKEPLHLRIKLKHLVRNGNYNNQVIRIEPDTWYMANWYTPKKTLLVYMPHTNWQKTIVSIKDVLELEEL